VVLSNLLTEERLGGIVVNAHDITEAEAASAKIHQREKVLETIGFTTDLLLRSARWEDVVGAVLKQLGETVNADEVVLVAKSERQGREENGGLWRWVRLGMTPQLAEMLDGDDQAEPTPSAERELATDMGAAAVVPISSGEKLWGALWIVVHTPRHTWKTTQKHAAQAVAGSLGEAIYRSTAEQQLQQSRQQLRRLTDHLQSAREQERTEIARTIHDELGQTLTALKLDLAWLSRRLGDDALQLKEKVTAMDGVIDDSIETVQQLATDLRPSLLDNLGLETAIEWQVETFAQRAEIAYKLSITPSAGDIPEEVKIVVYRILQECLSNVARHAQASVIGISLHTTDSAVELCVRDNGKGLDEAVLDEPSSLGIIGMRERARTLGGDVEITSFAGLGTKVTVVVPITHTPEEVQ